MMNLPATLSENHRTALVTGGGRGIGKGISLRLAREGYTVVLTYARNAEAAQETVEQIRAEGGQAVAREADVTLPGDLKTLFFLIERDFGKLEVLVNNAGIAEYRSLETVDAAFFDLIFNTNVRGSLLCARAAMPLMERAGGAAIINLSSSLTLSPTPNASVYAMSKAAIECMTQFLASEVGAKGITVNCVAPGLTQTEMLDKVISPEAKAELIRRTPLGRIGTMEEIAEAVAFLAGQKARWITGQVMVVNGGLR